MKIPPEEVVFFTARPKWDVPAEIDVYNTRGMNNVFSCTGTKRQMETPHEREVAVTA